MAERDPIELIREQLNGIDGLGGLDASHEAFKMWHGETKTILEKAFSSKSIHCQSFLALKFREMGSTPFSSPEIDKINAARYKRDLENIKNILQGAIKELTLDRTLFKKIQTRPKSVEFALRGEYYLSSGIDRPELIEAIQNVFEGSGLTPIRGSEAIQRGDSLHQRVDGIRSAKLGIYDLSSPEKTDILIELGAALGMGKEIALICRKGSPLPEAIRQLDRIEYEDYSDLTEKLKKKMHL